MSLLNSVCPSLDPVELVVGVHDSGVVHGFQPMYPILDDDDDENARVIWDLFSKQLDCNPFPPLAEIFSMEVVVETVKGTHPEDWKTPCFRVLEKKEKGPNDRKKEMQAHWTKWEEEFSTFVEEEVKGRGIYLLPDDCPEKYKDSGGIEAWDAAILEEESGKVSLPPLSPPLLSPLMGKEGREGGNVCTEENTP